MYMYASTSCSLTVCLPGIRNEFFGHVHKFLAQITDADHRSSSHTKLYIPDEGPIMHDPESHKSKDFVQRMEGRVVHVYTLCHCIICVYSDCHSLDSSDKGTPQFPREPGEKRFFWTSTRN